MSYDSRCAAKVISIKFKNSNEGIPYRYVTKYANVRVFVSVYIFMAYSLCKYALCIIYYNYARTSAVIACTVASHRFNEIFTVFAYGVVCFFR